MYPLAYFPRAQGLGTSADPKKSIFTSESDQTDLKSGRKTYHIALDDFTLVFGGVVFILLGFFNEILRFSNPGFFCGTPIFDHIF